MYILDKDTNKKIENIIIYLTKSEAKDLFGKLNILLKESNNVHAHISNETYQKEITVCIYDKENLSGFDARSIELITNDK